MKKIQLQRVKEDRTSMLRGIPREEHCSELIKEDCQLWLDGELRGIYIQHWEPAEKLRKHILSLKRWDHGNRLSGVGSISRNFGFSPRKPLHQGRDYCSQSVMSRDEPEVLRALYGMAAEIDAVLEQNAPERHQKQVNEVTARVRKEYIIPGSHFTSGIVNKNNPLQYHYDAGNFEGFFSAMIAFKHKTAGGHLAFPEYDCKLDIGDCSLSLFDGQCELHGVTPIVRDTQGYRFTIVFYTLESLWKCLPFSEEIKRAQASRTKSELRRAGLIK